MIAALSHSHRALSVANTEQFDADLMCGPLELSRETTRLSWK